VKVFGIVFVALLLLLAILKLTGVGGEHGPGRHLSFDDGAVMAPSSGVTGRPVPVGGFADGAGAGGGPS